MKFKSDSFVLKLIAIIAMTIDHIAALFFSDVGAIYFFMRCIGAVTFPVMAYLIGEGYRKTKDLKKYKLRLFCFSIISMLPFALAFGRDTLGLNVGFTLLFGLFAIEVYNSIKNIWLKWILIALISIFSFDFDWGFIGPLMILMLYLSDNDKKKIIASLLAGVILFVVKNYAEVFILYGKVIPINALINSKAFLRHIGFLGAALAIFSYDGTQKRKIKYLFYFYYPFHLFILGIIMRLV